MAKLHLKALPATVSGLEKAGAQGRQGFTLQAPSGDVAALPGISAKILQGLPVDVAMVHSSHREATLANLQNW